MSSLKTSYQFGLEAFDFDCYAEESIQGAFMGKKIHDDENVTITVLGNDEAEQEEGLANDFKVSVAHVEMIKAIIECEDTAKFHKTTAGNLKKKLVEETKQSPGFVSELISLVRKETDPEKGGNVLQEKAVVLSAAEQAVVLYPNVVVRPSIIAGANHPDGAGATDGDDGASN